MTIEAEPRTIGVEDRPLVSGSVITTLLTMVRARRDDAGVAQALALAGESRTFATLGDASNWSTQEEAVALINGSALITGDGALGLHIGESLLFVPDGTGFADRLRSLGTTEAALKHIGAVLGHFESASEAVSLELAHDHALVEVSPRTRGGRHAHLCEMTRGLLVTLPLLFDLERAEVTELECAARGGRVCLYAISWDGPEAQTGDQRTLERVGPRGPVVPEAGDHTGPGVAEVGGPEREQPDPDGWESDYSEPDDSVPDDSVPDDSVPDGGDASGREPDEWDTADSEPDEWEASGWEPDEWAAAESGRDVDPAHGVRGALDRDTTGSGGDGVPVAHREPVAGAQEAVDDGARAGDRSGQPTGWERRGMESATESVVAPPAANDRSVAELRAELNRMAVLIEGTFATALELLGDDVESLLSQIAARADAVVSAHRYLLMVRVRPDSPIQLHHRGLEAEEAQRLAAELWRDEGDRNDDSRLIVDITSPRRRYGRLVEFLESGAHHVSSENKVLSLYAEYAATALDIFGVLLDAKRSDATARTLLSFSESLAQVTKVDDLVQVLADTVPAVTQCDQSTVFLWDPEEGQMLPRARTLGLEARDASLGPIIPVPDGDSPAGTFQLVADEGEPVGDTVALLLGIHRTGPSPTVTQKLTVRLDASEIDRMINHHEVIVIDRSTEDPVLRTLLEDTGTEASLVAPMSANGAFLGVVAANFGPDTPVATIRDPDLHERLTGLADQAATALRNLGLLEKVSHMAWHDSLTGLPNRRLFEDRVGQELVRSRRVGEPVCMFFVDLDHFKDVNDNSGHAAGDDLIRQVGQRLVDTVRRQDTVARVGGDEFAILLPGLCDQLAIDQLAQRSLEALAAPFTVFGEEVTTSASIGIAMAPDHGDSYDELLSNADEAMYRAKGRGRNAFEMYSGTLVNTSEGRRAVDERSLYTDLVNALEHDEFFLVYQPYIDLRTSEVNGVEALIRWNHPTLGTLEPASFISLAERSDVIVALDTWVLDQSLRQIRTWMDRGLPPLRLSVNLASRDLSNPGFYATVERVLAETAIDPSLLELEITERVVLDRTGPGRENVERLRRLGVRFTIDDFGTGNSSLNRIGSFPVSTLKIDQSFVQVLGPDGDNNSLVSAIISMADRLGLNCVAEGVETAVQSRVLLQRGCTTAQGYFFSPPLAPDDIEAMMADIRSTGPTGPDDAPDDELLGDDSPDMTWGAPSRTITPDEA